MASESGERAPVRITLNYGKFVKDFYPDAVGAFIVAGSLDLLSMVEESAFETRDWPYILGTGL